MSGITDKLPDSARVSPFLKWAGGKRWLVSQGVPKPSKYNRLIEPFVGSAAVFFSLRPPASILSDISRELINLYCVMRDSPDAIYELMKEHDRLHSQEYYYTTRALAPGEDVHRAARVLYLNRTCWNGLYRVNRKGEFNVPIGTKTSVLWKHEDFCLYSDALKHSELKCQDFELTVDECGEGDFLFVDPPYTVKHNMNGFVKYNETMFSWGDQIRLVASLMRAGSRGASIVVTNADHDSVRDLYGDAFKYQSLSRQSVLAGSSIHRVKTTEALFTLNIS